MYTTIYLDPDQDAKIVRQIREECDRLAGTAATHAAFGDMYVKYSSNGISCQFGRLLTELPVLFQDLTINRVGIYVDSTTGLQAGLYRRKRSSGTIEDMECLPPKAPKYVIQRVNLMGDDLRSVRRLFNDLKTGRAKPSVAWTSQATIGQ